MSPNEQSDAVPDLDDALASMSAEEMAKLDERIKAGFSPVLAANLRRTKKSVRSPDLGDLIATGAFYPARAYLYDPEADDELYASILNATNFVLRRQPALRHEDLVAAVHEFLFGNEPLTRGDRLRFLLTVARAIAQTIKAHALELVAASTSTSHDFDKRAESKIATADTSVKNEGIDTAISGQSKAPIPFVIGSQHYSRFAVWSR